MAQTNLVETRYKCIRIRLWFGKMQPDLRLTNMKYKLIFLWKSTFIDMTIETKYVDTNTKHIHFTTNEGSKTHKHETQTLYLNEVICDWHLSVILPLLFHYFCKPLIQHIIHAQYQAPKFSSVTYVLQNHTVDETSVRLEKKL